MSQKVSNKDIPTKTIRTIFEKNERRQEVRAGQEVQKTLVKGDSGGRKDCVAKGVKQKHPKEDSQDNLGGEQEEARG